MGAFLFLSSMISLFAPSNVNAQSDLDDSVDQGNSGVALTIANPTYSTATLIWVDQNGQNQTVGSIPARSESSIETSPGHLFLLQAGKTTSRYRVTDQRTQKIDLKQLAAAQKPKWLPGKKKRNPVQPGGPEAGDPAQNGVSVSKLTAAERQAALNFHNQVRAEVGVGGLAWSEQLAGVAQQWADHIAATGRMKHRPRSGAGASQFGENLAMGFDGSGGYTVSSGMHSWYQEKSTFRAGQAVTNGNLQAIGHYTQMVWAGSTQFGMGKAVIQSGPQRGWLIIVANYNPPGNYIGKTPY